MCRDKTRTREGHGLRTHDVVTWLESHMTVSHFSPVRAIKTMGQLKPVSSTTRSRPDIKTDLASQTEAFAPTSGVTRTKAN